MVTNTTQVHTFRLPLCRSNIQQFFVFYRGPKYFNSLPLEFSGSSSLPFLRKKILHKYCHQLLIHLSVQIWLNCQYVIYYNNV